MSNSNKLFFVEDQSQIIDSFNDDSNFFNTENFRDFSISDIAISQTEFRLQSRYVLLKMEARF